jgi:uncharacterized membrane protein YbhN (UPF0104 family)
MKKILQSRYVRWGFIAVVLIICGYEVATRWDATSAALAKLNPVAAVAALACLLIGQFASLRGWQRLLAGLGSPLPTSAAARILFIGQLGKYLPGAVWPVLAQMELGNTYQIPRRRSASASLLAMLCTLLVSLLIAAVTLPFTGHAEKYLWVLAAVPPLLVCLYPPVLRWGMNRLLRLARQPELEVVLNGRVLASTLTWYAVSWLFNCAQLFLLLPHYSARAVLFSLGAFTLAW